MLGERGAGLKGAGKGERKEGGFLPGCFFGQAGGWELLHGRVKQCGKAKGEREQEGLKVWGAGEVRVSFGGEGAYGVYLGDQRHTLTASTHLRCRRLRPQWRTA